MANRVVVYHAFLKDLMSSLMLDLAHRRSSALRLVPGAFPMFVDADGRVTADTSYEPMTPESIIGVLRPIGGPCNPGDGPYGQRGDEILYALRGTNLAFGCRLVKQGSDARELEIRVLPAPGRG